VKKLENILVWMVKQMELAMPMNARVWEVEVTILMPSYALEIEAESEQDAIERALQVLNENGDIPEHGECDVDIREKDAGPYRQKGVWSF